jgi:putative holliday junction resolvase
MARLMALDYGKRRTGIAVSDPLQIIASGLDTVDTSQLLEYVKNYIVRESVERIVMGMPTQPNGAPSENAARVAEFAGRLRKAVSVPVEFYDERFTSVMAHQAMLDGGLHRKARQNKALVDKISATIILQSYMESHRNQQIQNHI